MDEIPKRENLQAPVNKMAFGKSKEYRMNMTYIYLRNYNEIHLFFV